MPATQVGFMTAPAGWFGDWHPSPRRQYLALLAGEVELEVSDGQVHRMRSGEVVLLDDTTGKGHRSRVVSSEPTLLIVVALPAA
jgi:quercetin dioxygenase-like cupin family protein